MLAKRLLADGILDIQFDILDLLSGGMDGPSTVWGTFVDDAYMQYHRTRTKTVTFPVPLCSSPANPGEPGLYGSPTARFEA